MRVIVVGLGVQGAKRKKVAGPDFVAAVDPVNADAEFRNLQDVPVERYDAALCCIPDGPKIELLTYLAGHGKHALVEKPLWAADDAAIAGSRRWRGRAALVLYTAYNHRFEPHYVAMRDLVADGRLGRLYHCRMFYGNGTARLVRESDWRDHGSGVLHDLGSHLLDTATLLVRGAGRGLPRRVFLQPRESRSGPCRDRLATRAGRSSSWR